MRRKLGFHLKVLGCHLKRVHLRIKMILFHREMRRLHEQMMRLHEQTSPPVSVTVGLHREAATCSAVNTPTNPRNAFPLADKRLGPHRCAMHRATRRL